jgi:putative FmdB family regulatory protein
MPFYEYRCKVCDHWLEEFQEMSDEPLKVCLKCGGDLKQLVSLSNGQVDRRGGEFVAEIKADAKRIADKIKGGDEDAAADIFGVPEN